MNRLSRRDRRALLIGASVFLVAITVRWVAPAAMLYRQSSREIADSTARMVHDAQHMLREESRAHESLDVRRARLASLESLTFVGRSQAALGAAFLERLARAAEESSADLGPAQLQWDSLPRSRQTNGTLTRAYVRASVSGSLENLTTFIADLEGGPEIVTFRDLAISRAPPALVPSSPAAFRADFTIEGIARLDSLADASTSSRRHQ
jgi:type II secretion system (T2SS) protein M